MASTSSIPKQLGDFEILRELGRGGMGVVYEARQKSLNRHVALKVLASSLGLTAKAVMRFKREAEAAAKLHHTNIVPIYFTGEEEGVYFYAMELIDGPSLDQVIRHMRAGGDFERSQDVVDETAGASSEALPNWVDETIAYERPQGKLSAASSSSPKDTTSGSSVARGTKYFDQVATMVADVADALQHAHDHGVISRDIKPSNLLLGSDGRLSVSDFGLARVLEQPGMTMTGEFVGTPRYMSPEQISAGRAPLDHRTDIYSLGATLYELLTLQPPFTGQSRDEVIGQILHKEPKAPRSVNRSIPKDLETICLKAMERDPDRRYQHAGEMANDLRAFVNRFAISAKRVGPFGKASRWIRRHPQTAMLSVMLIALACATGVFAYKSSVANSRLIDEAREDALIAIWSGDRENAERKIEEANNEGISEGWLHLLNGLLELHHGEPSLEELRKATGLLPDSTAAFAALVRANYESGKEVEYFRQIPTLERMQPDSFEDVLLKGWTLTHANAIKALGILNDAYAENKNSPIVRLIRADTNIRAAMEARDANDMLANAQTAITDALAAEAMLEDHPGPKPKLLRAYLLAAHACGELENAQGRQQYLEMAGEVFSALEHHLDYPGARRSRIAYAKVTEDPDSESAVTKEFRRSASGHPFEGQECAQILFGNHRYEEAAEYHRMAEQNDPTLSGFVHDFVEMISLSDRSDAAEARSEFVSSVEKRIETTGQVMLAWDWTVLRLYGIGREHPAALRLVTEFSDGYKEIPYWDSYKSFPPYMRDGDVDELIRAAGTRRTSLLYAYLFIGVDELANGNREDAKIWFQRAVDTGAFDMDGYGWAKAFLVLLSDGVGGDQEKVWLPWLDKETTDAVAE